MEQITVNLSGYDQADYKGHCQIPGPRISSCIYNWEWFLWCYNILWIASLITSIQTKWTSHFQLRLQDKNIACYQKKFSVWKCFHLCHRCEFEINFLWNFYFPFPEEMQTFENYSCRWTLMFHKILGIYRVAAQLVASRVVPSSTELVS
jgi:hypothetical protein